MNLNPLARTSSGTTEAAETEHRLRGVVAQSATLRAPLWVLCALVGVTEVFALLLSEKAALSQTVLGWGNWDLKTLVSNSSVWTLPWLVMAVAGLWPRSFLRASVALFALSVVPTLIYLLGGHSGSLASAGEILALMTLLPGTVAVFYCVMHSVRAQTIGLETRVYLALGLLVLLLGAYTTNALAINYVLFPRTFDNALFRVDTAYGAFIPSFAARVMATSPLLESLTHVCYELVAHAIFIAIGLALRSRRLALDRLWRFVLLPYVAAVICYAWLPVTGPAYAFVNSFPASLPSAETLAFASTINIPAFRNAMPSMHFAAAWMLFLLALFSGIRVATGLSAIFVIGTAWATLALGEHYVIDLVVALPFVVALAGFAAIPRVRLAELSGLRSMLWICAALFVGWMLVLRFAPVLLADSSLLLWGATLITCACAALGMTRLGKAVSAGVAMPSTARLLASTDSPANLAVTQEKRDQRLMICLFFVSGFAGLVYEVVFAKALALTFGSTALANYTVLATYMGGMAVGAWLGGRWAARTTAPLHAYAICELGIGIYAVATPLLFQMVQWAYLHFGEGFLPDAPVLTVMRVALGASILMLPTVLMGATLPLALKHLRATGFPTASSIATLYGSNVLGASFGSLFAGYGLLPALGRSGATYVAALLGLLIALVVLRQVKLLSVAGESPIQQQPLSEGLGNTLNAGGAKSGVGMREFVAAMLVLILGGTVTLAVEVIYIHLLSVVAGNSVYAFALMLATFLCGLGLGAQVARRVTRFTRVPPLLWLVLAQLGVAASISLCAHVWDAIPVYFGSFAYYIPNIGFGGRELIRGLVCFVAMVPPALFIGFAYPFAMDVASRRLGHTVEQGTGIASAWNTFGNICGVFVGGYLLLPHFGSLDSLRVVAGVALALGIVVLTLQIHIIWRQIKWRYSLVGATVAVVFLLFHMPKQFDMDDLTNGANVYFSPQQWGTYVEHAESVEGGLTSVSRSPEGTMTLLTNGKFQGNNSDRGEMVAQVGFAIAPLLHTPKRNNALVIGYGTGVTTRVLHASGFAQVDVAELSTDVVTLADRYFANVNDRVLSQKNVRLYITDGRNLLLTQPATYDLISMEITSIWFAGAANLYNREFYELAKKRLRSDGVLQQWIQLHHITARDVAYILGSVRSEFRLVWLYVVGGQGIIVATNSPASVNNVEATARLVAEPALQQLLQQYSNDPVAVGKSVVLAPGDVNRLLVKYDPALSRLFSTDNNLYLEYSTPKGNALDETANADTTIRALRKAAELP